MHSEAEIEEPKKSGGSDKSEFTDEIFTAICERMAEGEGLREICRDPEMPSRSTVLRWVENDTGRQAKYQKAREALMDFYAEEIRTIAWDDSKDTIKREGKADLCNHEWIARSRLKVDTLKFLMAKLHPKRYGDKLPETVEQRSHEATLLELEANQPQKMVVRWERTIIAPIHDDDGKIINAADPGALRKRIIELEQRLGIRDGKPLPPRLLTYDPGPLPSRIEGEIVLKLVDVIKQNVPRADQRPPEEVLDEVLAECAKALQAKYGKPETA
jgi:hypothetical protein